ncbi:MAG TPA: serine/threonine-protein kinase, partial [Candidatus Edwardsbacteria bacterium]|nr:serine/threonine-protein kinase [Candidatus Edwardsbacteria bacterium]
MSQRVGNYIIDRTLSTGGMATIHLGHHAELGRQAVIKQLHPHLSRDEGFVRRFEREAKILGSLHHENIVDVLDYFEHQGSYYIVLEYIDGGSLKQLLERQRRVPFHIAVQVALQVAEGLRHAHLRGIVHRDVKPGNVLLSRSGTVKLTDFGLASATEAMAITDPGTFVGTPAYLAPEQIKGHPATARSDLYALGVVLYETLAGENPFGGKTHSESIDRTLRVVPKGIPRTDPEVPPGLERIVAKLLAKEPRDRYPSCGELIEELSQYRLIKPEALTRYLADPAAYQPRQEDQDEIIRLVAREKRNLLLSRIFQASLLALLALLVGVLGTQQLKEYLRQRAAQRPRPPDTTATAPATAPAAAPRQIIKVLGTENADITINGKPAGKVPAIFDDLKPGTLTIAVAKPGYASQQRQLKLAPGQTATAQFDLIPQARAPGYLA